MHEPINEKSLPMSDSVLIDDIGNEQISDHRDDIFFAAIETTRMPMLVTDPRKPDNPIVFANRAFVAMTGYAVEEIVGKNCRFLQGEKTSRAAVAEIRQAISEKREISLELLNYKKNGATFWNALFISPVFSKQGELVYYFASQLDVSRRRDAEEALAQSQKMEALGLLTGGIAHDFNNLLHVISGHLDLFKLQAGRENALGPRTARSVELMSGAVQRASELTQQLLAFSRKQVLRGRTINLNTAVQDVAALTRGTLGHDVRLTLDLQDDLPNCDLDPTQLQVAMLNLLVNARDAMPPEGGTITLATRSVEVTSRDEGRVAELEPGAYVSVSISDDGSGIDPALLGRVMDPFFTTKEEGKGTGLGLSSVYGFTKQSHGTTTIDSERGIGTTVRLYFPVSASSAAEGTIAYSEEHLYAGTERILVVEDRREVGELACAMLQQLGYQATLCENGRAAVKRMRELPADELPHLVFTDVVMPGGMNGYAVGQFVREFAPSCEVLLTTGFDRDLASADQDLRFDVIRKPYRLVDLAKRIRQILDGQTGTRRAPR